MKQNKEIPAGYKDSPLGIIPEEWEVKKLDELGTFLKGKGIPKDKIKSFGNPCLTYGDIYTKYNFVVKDIKSFIDDSTALESQKIEFGDILFAGSGETIEDIGKCVAYIDKEIAYAGGDIIILKPYKAESITLSYILNSSVSNKQKYKFGQGHSIVHIYPFHLKKIEIALPTLPEQKKIAEILFFWDKAIEKQERLVEKLERRKRGLMQQLLNKKKQLREYVAEWQIVKLGDCIREFNEKPKEKIKYEILTSSNKGLVKQTDYYGDNRITNREEVDYNVIPPNYVTYRSRSDDGLFTFNKNTYGIYGLVSGYYPVFTALNCNIDFLVLFLNYFKTKLSKFSTGTSQLVLSFSSLISAKFKLPNYEEQTAIAEVFTTADQEINSAKAKLNSLIIQKKGLMQQLLTGKTRVKL